MAVDRSKNRAMMVDCSSVMNYEMVAEFDLERMMQTVHQLQYLTNIR